MTYSQPERNDQQLGLHDVVFPQIEPEVESRKRAVQMARKLTLLGIVPTYILICFVSLQKWMKFGPLVTSTYGVGIKSSIILWSRKLHKFTIKTIEDLFFNQF